MRNVRVLDASERTEPVPYPYDCPAGYPYLEPFGVYEVAVHITDGWNVPTYRGFHRMEGEGVILVVGDVHGTGGQDFPWVFNMARFRWTDEEVTQRRLKVQWGVSCDCHPD
jgi:hypothetical protein